MSDVSINGGISPTSTHHPIIHLWKLVPFPRHQLIESKILQRTDNEVDTALCLWEKRALELTAIIGEGGFSSLYARAGFVD